MRGTGRYLPVQKAMWQDIKGSKVLMGTYEESVKMMGDISFLSALMKFPKECINDETIELLQPYFAAPDFNFDSAKKVRWCMRLTCIALGQFKRGGSDGRRCA